MKIELKTGDKVVLNPTFNPEIDQTWWVKEARKEIMTIEEEVFTNIYSVKENALWWKGEWFLLIESNFLKPEDFEI